MGCKKETPGIIIMGSIEEVKPSKMKKGDGMVKGAMIVEIPREDNEIDGGK